MVRKLQKTLMKSWSAKMLAVRKVTQENKGKRTAGIDGRKALTGKQRLILVDSLKIHRKPKPTRRVWIDKPGRNEKRPLGIPTIYDRALQALTKQAIEPEWEAKFEPNSYGFRPGRSCHDAIEAIYSSINKKPKWVLDADISKCFDKISHEALLKKLNTYPTLRKLIRAWLKAGVMDRGTFSATDEGTPQGGIISPLLANIALHGMEKCIEEYANNMKGSKEKNRKALTFVRYADDFVIMHKNKEVVAECQEKIGKWLKGIGLELKPSKTKIVHTYSGFDFLGFHIKQHKVGKNHSKPGFKTIIEPSKKKVTEHYKKLEKVIESNKSASQANLIYGLKPQIIGWCNYYRSVCSKETFSDLDRKLWNKLRRWGKRRHPQKAATWVMNKYWGTTGEDNWVFKDKEVSLPKHAKTPIIRHVKVKDTRSIYEGDLIYWGNRMGKHPMTSQVKGKLFSRQKGICPECKLKFQPGDLIEVHHKIPRTLGGNNELKNLELLHLHCHDKKHGKKIKPIELDSNPF
ncbi:group II intron reverse transcriptase/maturase [Moorena producens]|uniref:group II intron reverse transcriptase/maturase n=1 Tax=Moorena producens TaxID=1155739 RepID=UPI000A8C8429